MRALNSLGNANLNVVSASSSKISLVSLVSDQQYLFVNLSETFILHMHFTVYILVALICMCTDK